MIKIIKGAEVGQEFVCGAGEAVVGRSPRSVVRLGSAGVSYEHAVITRNGEEFFIENLSAAGTYVNDERISGKVRLRAKDQLRFGTDTVARVEAVPSGGGAGERRRWMMYGVGALVIVLVVLAVADPFSGGGPGIDSKAAYAKLEVWTQAEVERKDLPPEASALLREAWRLEKSGDRAGGVRLWRKLEVLLAAQEAKLGFQYAADHDAGALARLAKGDKKGGQWTDEEMGAALVQFVGRMERGK